MTEEDGDNGRLWCGGPYGTFWFSFVQPYLKTDQVFNHEGSTGRDIACQGWWKPAGCIVSLNNVVHTRNRLGAGWATPVNTFDVDAGGDPYALPTPILPYWKTKTDKDGNPGTYPGWAATLHESQVNAPTMLVSATETGRGAGLDVSGFVWRGYYHRSYGASFGCSPNGQKVHLGTATVLFVDGHVESVKCETTHGGPMGEPRKWNNSPFPDGGGWNRNRNGDPADDIYHGAGSPGDDPYPNPKRQYPGWIPVADQLNTDPANSLARSIRPP